MTQPIVDQVQTYTQLWERAHDLTSDSGFDHQPWCKGHGWMLRSGVLDVIAPLLHGSDDYFHFSGLNAVDAAQLLELLPPDYLTNERQNDGPSIGCVLRALLEHPDDMLAHGYVIGAGRCDERITVEGVLVHSQRSYRLCPLYGPEIDDCECTQLWQSLQSDYGITDAIFPPDELDCWPRFGTLSGAGCWYRAWWD